MSDIQAVEMYCTGTMYPRTMGYFIINGTIAGPVPVADFTGSPRNGTAPQYVSFVDNSTNWAGYNPVWNWSVSPMDGVLVAPQDLDNQDITILFTENGNFSITHGLKTDYGSSIKTRTDYIHIYNASALSTFRVRAVDTISGYGINGAKVDVFDIENASWLNQTSVMGEVTVSALTGHNINAYGSATGYDDGESLNLPVVAGSLYPIYMNPSDMGQNVSAGNLTLYVTALEYGTNTRLPGFSVSVSGPSSGGASFTSGETNENGIFQIVVANKTNYNIAIPKQKGHLGANKAFNSGTQVGGGDAFVEETLWLEVDSVTTAPTVTTLSGGGTPAPILTYLANCNPSASDYDAAKCRTSKGGFGLDILANNLESLIWICLIVTVIYLFKGIGK
jgi:PKD repeat protein